MTLASSAARAVLAAGVALPLAAAVLARCTHEPALAAPPAIGSDDHQILSPHGPWVRSLTVPGSNASCCDESDCRPVDARRGPNGWQVRWRPGQLPGAPTEWTDVPESAVLVRDNPTGIPIACWYGGAVRCFVPASAT